MEGIINWAILGAGRIAHTFAKDFPLVHYANLLAVGSRDPGKALSFSMQYSIPRALSYEELYVAEDIQAVYIATPHNFHFEQAKNCILNGKSVLCEKPITINDRQFSILSSLAREKRVFLMEALWSYFLPALQEAKKWILEGRIGEIKFIQANFGYDLDKNPEGRLYNPHLAGGALLDIGIYPLAISLFFLEKLPNRLESFALMTNTGVDARISVQMDFDPAMVQIMVALDILLENKMVIYGEKGILEIFEYWKAKKFVLKDLEHQVVDQYLDDRDSHGFVFQIQEATHQILKKEVESEVIPHQRSLEIQEILTQIRGQIGLKYPMEVE
jgi:predicted dehydrogenase